MNALKTKSIVGQLAVFVRACSIGRHHAGDDQRDPGVHREEDAGRYPGTGEAWRRSQSSGLAGSHAGTFSESRKVIP